MERTFTLIFLFAAVEGKRHIYVSTPKTWSEAQAYCNLNHIDLSSVVNKADQDKLQNAAAGSSLEGWIGLHRSPVNVSVWTWSTGESFSYHNWDVSQPDSINGVENAAHLLKSGKWNDARDTTSIPFYCQDLTTVMEQLSWEEALDYCRQNLSCLPSKSNLIEAQKVVQMDSDPMWIGLRYLSDRWLWMSGEPLDNSLWPLEDQCPTNKRCGVLTKTGEWKAWDCQDRLNFICT